MSQENVEIVRRICEGWASGDFGVGVADFDPHVMIRRSTSLPGVRCYVGPDGIREYTRRFLEQYERVTIEATRLQVAGDTIRKEGKLAGTRIRKQIADLDRKIKAQIQALENGIEPELVSERIAELRGEKEALEQALEESRRSARRLKPRSSPNSWQGSPT